MKVKLRPSIFIYLHLCLDLTNIYLCNCGFPESKFREILKITPKVGQLVAIVRAERLKGYQVSLLTAAGCIPLH